MAKFKNTDANNLTEVEKRDKKGNINSTKKSDFDGVTTNREEVQKSLANEKNKSKEAVKEDPIQRPRIVTTTPTDFPRERIVGNRENKESPIDRQINKEMKKANEENEAYKKNWSPDKEREKVRERNEKKRKN